MKTAIVYDWIDKWGGVERVLLTLHEMFPSAEFFTSYYDPKNAKWAQDLKIKTSFMQNLPDFIKRNRVLSLPFYPYAFESFNFKGYDLVISVTSSFAKSVITRPETRHICYLLTPTRYFWMNQENWIKPFASHYQRWDFAAAKRPDKMISISQTVARRCKKFYKRDSTVIYPPFDLKYWNEIKLKIKNQKSIRQLADKNKNYFLIVSRLEPYKKVDLAIKTFNNLPKESLIIVGKGTQEDKLKRMAGDNIQFFKDLTDVELGELYSKAHALVMPQKEDFGYAALEAQFFNCPVIAYGKGGATETVIEGKTGVFFEKQNTKDLAAAVKRCDKIKSYESRDLRRWSRDSFVAAFTTEISQTI